ncbi:hypothetical protein [Niveispirillum sp. BGYR6]|uniref:hypothetical protein n=1 Tax=Niveispirillum sp. BGYR6 TaxID=2971249 RepID=UPI0022B99742|nr:hypothetical protein [Niveispirillum sp. BGYR6]MDG5497421.1 hypothetical protein [Niveispirillum sp. BGYR6]
MTGRADAPPPSPSAPPAPERREDYPVLECLVPLALLFLRAASSMRRPAMGGPPLGMDWVQVQALASMTGFPITAWDVDTLDDMAAAACTILHEQAARLSD